MTLSFDRAGNPAEARRLLQQAMADEEMVWLDEGRQATVTVHRLRSDSTVTFRYECRHCGENWDCIPGKGWRSDTLTPAPSPPPLLRRLAAVARSRLERVSG